MLTFRHLGLRQDMTDSFPYFRLSRFDLTGRAECAGRSE